VDGVSQGVVAFYLFSNVQADHTISAVFVSDIAQLIQSYYLNILDRPAEPAGLDFWVPRSTGCGLGIDIKEGFIALEKAFFNSAEYLGWPRWMRPMWLIFMRLFCRGHRRSRRWITGWVSDWRIKPKHRFELFYLQHGVQALYGGFVWDSDGEA